MNCGGSIILIVVVLFAFHEGTQDEFGCEYQERESYETINPVKARPVFPFKNGMLIEIF